MPKEKHFRKWIARDVWATRKLMRNGLVPFQLFAGARKRAALRKQLETYKAAMAIALEQQQIPAC